MKKQSIKLLSIILLLQLMIAACVLSFTVNPRRVEAATAVPQELYYGRNQLKGNASFLAAYDAVCEGVAAKNTSIPLDACDITIDEFKMVFELYRNDHTEQYWLPNSYSYSYLGDKIYTLNLAYLTGFDATLYATKVQEYLDLCEGLTSEYEIALTLHDALVKNVSYVLNASNAHNSYGAIVGNKAVCEGYAEAYQYLLQLCGIQSYIVTGYAGEAHEWNIVRIDGNYYHTDVTWDDPVTDNDAAKPVYHGYFNISTARISQDHTVIDDEYSILPACTDESKLYAGLTVIDSLTADNVAAAITVTGNIGKADIMLDPSLRSVFDDWLYANKAAVMSKTVFNGLSVGIGWNKCGCERIITVTGPTQPATNLTVDKSTSEIRVGKTDKITATLLPAGYCSDVVVWTSSDATVATVAQDGTVTAVKEGTATITATAGEKTATCAVTVKPACDHDSKTEHAAQDSTCTVKGWDKYYTCDACGNVFDQTDTLLEGIPYRELLPHSGGTANCHSKATCDSCGAEYGALDATNHDGATAVKDAVAATCTDKGYSGDTYCLSCGEKISDGAETAVIAHSYSDTYLTADADATKHYHVCTMCGVKDDGEAHTGGTANCHSKANCDTCGAEYGEVDPANHDGETEVRGAKASTCAALGYTGDTYCLGCNTKLSSGSDIAKLDHTYSDTYLKDNADSAKHYHVCTACEAKDGGEDHVWNYDAATEDHDKHCTVCEYVAQSKLGHTHSGTLHTGYAPTCTAVGEKDYYVCTCGKNFEEEGCTTEISDLSTWKVISATGHSFADGWTVDTAATCTQKGSKSHHCANCDAVSDVTEIEATGHSYGKPTWNWGDDKASAVAVFTCINCGEGVSQHATVTAEVTREATQTKDGLRTYTARVTLDGIEYSDVKTETIPRTGSGSSGSGSIIAIFGCGSAVEGGTALIISLIVCAAMLLSVKLIRRKK